MAIGTQTGVVRGQNIQGQESEQDRIARLQLADQQEALARSQMAQQNTQFGQEMADREKTRDEAAQQAASDRLYGLIGGGVSGLLGAGGSVLGGWMGKK